MDSQGGKIVWQIDAVKTGFTSVLASAVGEAKAAANTLNKIDLGGNFKSAIGDLNDFGDAVTRTVGVTAALGGVIGGVFVKSAADLDKASTSFRVLIGNTEVANQLFGQLADYAQNTPFEFPQIAKGAQTLLGFGVQAKDIQGVIAQLGDVAGATGGDFNALALVTGQIFAQGRIQAQDFYQIINSGAGSLGPLIAKNLGENGVGALRKRFEEGTVSAQAFFDALQQATAQGGFAFEGTNKLAQTFSGRLATLKDQLLETGRNLLGVKIDPALGLTVASGGVFDLLTRLLPQITSAAAILGPALASGFGFIIQNGPTIISIITSIAAAFVAFKVIGATLGIITALANPVTAALTAIAIILGVVVFNAAKSLQAQIKELFATFGAGTKDMKSAANSNLPPIKSAVAGVSDQSKQLSKNIAQAAVDFRQSLADIAKNHTKTLQSLRDQVTEEKETFLQAQAEKTASFNKSQAAMQKNFDKNTTDIQKQIDAELKKGRLGDRTKIADLRARLETEAAEFAASTAEKKAEYDADVANAAAAQAKKQAALQTQVDAELAFQQKHAADLKGVRDEDALDEIQKLKQSRDRQVASFNEQRSKVEASSAAQALTLASNFNNIPKLIDQGKFDEFGKKLGTLLADGLKKAFLEGFANMVNGISKSIGDFVLKNVDVGGRSLKDLANSIGSLIPRFASGVTNFSGGMALVGERGPELVDLPAGSNVHSNADSQGMLGGSNVNITLNLSGVMARSRSDVRAIGKELIGAVNEELRARRIPEIAQGAF